jgi:hypothetical protein
VAARVTQKLPLRFGFNPLSHHIQAQRLGQADHTFDDGA